MTTSILAITGSLRAGSYNTLLAKELAARAPAPLAISITGIGGIPIYNGDDDRPDGKPAPVLELAERIRAAKGVIIVSPEYNYSIPGGLKNALDWLSRLPDQPFKDKRVAIAGAAMGPLGTGRMQYHLRQVLQFLEAQVMPKPEIFLGAAHTKFDAQGKLTDQPTADVITAWLSAFTAWVARG